MSAPTVPQSSAFVVGDLWIDPIGRGIRTVCLNLGEWGYFGNQLPQTVDELTVRSCATASPRRCACPFSTPIKSRPTFRCTVMRVPVTLLNGNMSGA